MANNGKLSIIFNTIMFISSVFFVFYMFFVWNVRDPSVVAGFFISFGASFLYLHSLKHILLKDLSEVEMENQPISRKKFLLLFFAILTILILPIFILFLNPRIWLFIIDGIVCAASVSNLILYYKKRKRF